MNENKYIEAMKCIEISPETKHRILAKSIKTKQSNRRYIVMSKKKVVLVAAVAATMILSISAFAASGIISSWFSSSSRNPDYATLPTVEQTVKDVGYAPVLIEKFKSFKFEYTKGGDVVILSQMPQNGALISSENENDIYFTSYTNKVVPEDYELTEEDKNAEQNGELIFSYGSNEVIISEVKSVSWSVGDLHFNLMQIDGNLSADDLTEMANYILSQN